MVPGRRWARLLLALVLAAPAAASEATDCRPPQAWQPLPAPAPEAQAMAPPEVAGTYSHRLRTFPAGWPVLRQWCVWIEPASGAPGAALWDERWRQAMEAALAQWGQELTIVRSDDPVAAQVRVYRRRPPLLEGPGGQRRASHGRALLQVGLAQRQQQWWLEPRVDVLLGSTQGPLALQATALHELGHAFGLWGHSDQAGDVMAAVPGAQPVLQLSLRDRATLQWLLRQPTPFGQPALPPAANAGPPAPGQ